MTSAPGTAPIWFHYHIPKTGGQTLRDVFAARLVDGVRYAHVSRGARYEHQVEVDRLRSWAPAHRNVIEMVGGHTVDQETRRWFPGREHRELVVVREPVDRIISHYNWKVGERRRLERDVPTFEQWYDEQQPDPMLRFLATVLEVPSEIAPVRDRLRRCSLVADVTEMNEWLPYLLRQLHVDDDVPPPTNVSGRDHAVALDADLRLRRRIESDHPRDAELYAQLAPLLDDGREMVATAATPPAAPPPSPLPATAANRTNPSVPRPLADRPPGDGVDRSDLGPVWFHYHVPKTGGQTLRTVFGERLGHRLRFVHLRGDSALPHTVPNDELRAWPAARRAGIRMVAGHEVDQTTRTLFTEREHHELVVLREPAARIVSLHNFWTGLHERRDEPVRTFEQFYADLRPNPVLGFLARRLGTSRDVSAVVDRLEACTFVADLAEMDQWLPGLLGELGVDTSLPERSNVSGRDHERHIVLDDSLAERIAVDHALDVELYERAGAIIERHRSGPIATGSRPSPSTPSRGLRSSP